MMKRSHNAMGKRLYALIEELREKTIYVEDEKGKLCRWRPPYIRLEDLPPPPEDYAAPDGEEYDPTIGDWECETSPIGVCIYDRNGYNGAEHCVYCHSPEERK